MITERQRMTPREEKFIDTITNVRVLLLTTHETYEWGQARMGRVALLLGYVRNIGFIE